MRGFEWKTILAAAIAGSTLFLAMGAQAHDDDDWRWRHRHYRHWQGPERVFVERQPVFVERARPVYVAPAPIMMAPMMPAYSQPVDPSVNLNFTIPLR
jgi:hypothetical protein